VALIGDNIQELGELLLEVQEEPALFADEEWRTEMLQALYVKVWKLKRANRLSEPVHLLVSVV